MNTRCFAFGCSITHWFWGTCADYIGSNFTEYYNLGKPGASNTYMMNRLIEADNRFKFNPTTDTVIIGMTGFGRFSFFKDHWHTHGDILGNNHPEAVNIFNYEWALYNSYIAIKVIKEYLTSKNIKHYIYAAVDYEHWITDADLMRIDPVDAEKVNEIRDILDVKESINGYVTQQRRLHATNGILFQNNDREGHPTQKEHYEYFSNHFPQFNTQEAIDLYNKLESNFDYSSRTAQSVNFVKLYPHRSGFTPRLFL